MVREIVENIILLRIDSHVLCKKIPRDMSLRALRKCLLGFAQVAQAGLKELLRHL